MDREQMRMAILNQEQTFRQQVHELHRVYRVQKQLMRQMQITKLNNQSPAIAAATDAETKPRFEIYFNEKAISHHQFKLFSNSKNPASSAEEEEEKEECDLELTLATGNSSSSSSSTRSDKGKIGVVKSSNSDSGTTAVSSTSTDSELAQRKEFDMTTVRFQSESKKRLVDVVGEVNCQPPWLNSQCLSLRMA